MTNAIEIDTLNFLTNRADSVVCQSKESEPMKFYVSTYCNFAHDLVDGKPIAHECRVLPVAALEAERAGDFDMALELIYAAPRVIHRGKKLAKVAAK